MQVHTGLIGRVVALGLGLIFVALIACSLWATTRIARATDHATAAVSLSDLYADVGRQLELQDTLARRHQLDLNPSGWDKQLAASIATHATLTTISQSAAIDDRNFAQRMLKLQQSYFEMLLGLYSAVDSGSPMLATILEEKSAGPLFAEMQTTIAKRAAYQHGQALEALRDLASTQRVNVRTIFITTILGLFELGVGIFVFAWYGRTVEQRRRMELAAFERASLTDNLTALGNHRAFQEELDAQVARVGRHGGVLSLAVLDIDEFKGLNDRSGHLYGDRVLAAMGALLGDVRKCDRTFRIGGDEFAIVLPETQTSDASIMMERIRNAAPARLFGATLSIGIATMTERNLFDAVHLRAQADAALYAGKQSGRNTVMTYADAERGELVLCPDKAQAVRELIHDGHVDVVFQPIWDAYNGVPFGFEALARPAARYGFAGPQEVFEIAERLGRAPALDAVCLDAILARASEVPSAALLFINIVPETLARDLLGGDALVQAVRRAGIAPEQVVIELTERAMPRLDVIVREAKRLQSLGFKLALDDTGSGNAGLEVLRQLAVDFVKIDRTVMIQAMSDEIARAIVASIVVIAHAMGATVIAEGIETNEALDFVLRDAMLGWQRDCGIRGVQGYLLGRPAHAPWTGSTFDEHAAFMREYSESAKVLAGSRPGRP
jgi:diguanylate cyclase (GGDEF)-like protein